MAVVAFPADLSPQGPEPSMSWELRSLTARNMSPLNGVATTLERAGAHWAASLPYANLSESRRARLQTFAAAARGHAQRFYMPVFGWTRRGSFPATELVPSLASTTGWGASANVGSAPTLAASDSVLRATLTGYNSNPFIQMNPSATVTAYAPYCGRGLALHGRGASQVYTVFLTDGTISIGAGTSPGMNSAAIVLPGTAMAFIPVTRSLTQEGLAGDYFELGYASLARCALVDNGPNLLLQSDEFDTSWSATQASVDDQATIAPDGTTTADSIIEDTNPGTHFVIQSATVSSAAADFSFTVAVKAGARTWAQVAVYDGTSFASTFINLSSGALGTTTGGASWTNARAFAQSLGNGWYQVSVVARKTSSSTAVSGYLGTATGDLGGSYTGNGTSNVYAWRGTLAQSSVPTRLVQTTTTATTGTSQTGSALYLKGLPASTAGLLLQGDPAEIIIGTTSQLVRTRGSLDSDAAGLGYWQFEPPLRVSPSDGAAVIIHNPLCKMMMDDNVNGWTDRAAGFSDLEFALVEDTYPS